MRQYSNNTQAIIAAS